MRVATAIYLRTATAPQETPDPALDGQEARCRAYAAAQGYGEPAVYVDIATRAQLVALQAATAQGEVHTIIVDRPDRLSRDLQERRRLLQRFEHAGAHVHFVEGGLTSMLV